MWAVGQQVVHRRELFMPIGIVGKGANRKVRVWRVKACAVLERTERAMKECADGAGPQGAVGKRWREICPMPTCGGKTLWPWEARKRDRLMPSAS